MSEWKPNASDPQDLEKMKLWLEHQNARMRYASQRKWKDILFVFLFLGTLFCIGLNDLVQSETIAALLGAVLGFIVEHWRKD